MYIRITMLCELGIDMKCWPWSELHSHL